MSCTTAEKLLSIHMCRLDDIVYGVIWLSKLLFVVPILSFSRFEKDVELFLSFHYLGIKTLLGSTRSVTHDIGNQKWARSVEMEPFLEPSFITTGNVSSRMYWCFQINDTGRKMMQSIIMRKRTWPITTTCLIAYFGACETLMSLPCVRSSWWFSDLHVVNGFGCRLYYDSELHRMHELLLQWQQNLSTCFI